MKTIDLFAGAGGITEGFRQAGFQCLYANDIDPSAAATFAKNHPEGITECGPVEEADPETIQKRLGLRRGHLDVLVGGPPCQGFSINSPGRFIEDSRNQLFKHYLSFVDVFLPKVLFFENVPGMLSLGGGAIFQHIVEEIEAKGYSVEAKILFAAHYGVPQERWRVIILGTRGGIPVRHPTPTHFINRRANFAGGSSLVFRLDDACHTRLTPPVTVHEAIGDLPTPSLLADSISRGLVYYDADQDGAVSDYASMLRNKKGVTFNHVASRLGAVNLERLNYIKPGGSWRDIPIDLLPAGMRKARRSDHTKRYGRLHPEGLASTIMTKCDPHWGPVFHPVENRTLTVREAARFQSFPDSYEFMGSRVMQYEQVGNAVPPLMAKAVAEEIKAHLSEYRLQLAI